MIIATHTAIALLMTIYCTRGLAQPKCDSVDHKIFEIQNKIISLTESQSKHWKEVQKLIGGWTDDVQQEAKKYVINRFNGPKGPCQDYNILNDISRNINQPGGEKCDRTLLMAGLWYRFEPPAGTQLPETPPPVLSCGTRAPMWLNGSHPTTENIDIVERQLCANWDGNPCKWSTTVQAVLCPGGYYVYRAPLSAAPDCPLGWCAASLPLPLPRPQSFVVVPSSGFQVDYSSTTLGLTEDGHVLIAAVKSGLSEHSNLGSRLSLWQPADKEEVSSLAVLRDGRVIVSTEKGVIFLKRSASTAMTAGGWREDHRIGMQLHSAECLSVYDDVLAVVDRRYDWQSGNLFFPMQLELINITSGVKYATLNRDYRIASVVLTYEALITMSYGTLSLSNGSNVFVIDAHSREDDRHLWRYERDENDGALLAICADSSGRLLYVLVLVASHKRAILTVLSVSDGSELRRFALTLDVESGPQPWKITMGRANAKSVLAVLHKYRAPPNAVYVTMHPSDDF